MSALALFCGEFEFLTDDLQELGESAAAQLQHIAFRVYHSASDNYIPASNTESMFTKLCSMWKGEQTQFNVAFDDPEPPSWDSNAKVEFDVEECGASLTRSMWIYKDYVYQGDDSWKGYRKKRVHVMWPLIYLNENKFGLFEWLRKHRSSAAVYTDLAFEVCIPFTLSGHQALENQSSTQLGVSLAVSDTSDKADDSAGKASDRTGALVVGPGYFDQPSCLSRKWNLQQKLLGKFEHCILSGDQVLAVDGCPSQADAMAERLRHLDATGNHVTLYLKREFEVLDHEPINMLQKE